MNTAAIFRETYGVPVDEIVEGIKYGVRKVNIDTDLRMASTGAMRRILPNPKMPRNWMHARPIKPPEMRCRRFVRRVMKHSALPGTPVKLKPSHWAKWLNVISRIYMKPSRFLNN